MRTFGFILLAFAVISGSVMAAEVEAPPAILAAIPADSEVITLNDGQLSQIQGTSLLTDLLPAGHPSLQDSLTAFLAADNETRVDIILLHVEYILNLFM